MALGEKGQFDFLMRVYFYLPTYKFSIFTIMPGYCKSKFVCYSLQWLNLNIIKNQKNMFKTEFDWIESQTLKNYNLDWTSVD